MQENHVTRTDAEHKARNSIATQRRSYLVEASAHRSAGWHADWPSILNSPDISSYKLPIVARQRHKPLTHRFASGFGFEEGGWNPFE
jgi:hypothetical protein